MINIKQLKDLIERTLKEYDLHSESATNLLLGTCLQESRGGTYLRQMSKNFDIDKHAIGIMQMEKNTFDWLSEKYDTKLWDYNVRLLFGELEYNLKYSILFTRLRYLAVSEKLPEPNDIDGLAAYWKKYYNTIHGSGTEQEFIDNYNKYVLR